MIINPFRFGFSDTTGDGKQVFLAIGDSNGDGRGTTLGPTTISGTMFLWNGSGLTTITTDDISNSGPTEGTLYKQFALNYNARTSFNPVIVQQCAGGSNFYPDGDNNNWYTSGTLYAAAKTEADDCLTFLSLTKLKGIIVTLGINDNRAGTSLADILTGITSLFSRLRTDYPGVPIIINQVGRSEVGVPSNGEESFGSRLYAMRRYLFDEANNNALTYLLAAPIAGIGISGHYNADNLHYSQTMNNFIGAQIDRVYLNKDTYSKWTSCIASSFYDAIGATRTALIDTFILAEIANGNFYKYEFFSLFKNTTQNNCFVDWSFQGYLFNNTSVVFTANDNLSSNGTTNNYAFTFIGSISNRSASQTDFITGVKVKVNSTAQGTLACVLGGSDGADVIAAVQNTTPALTYRCSDATINTTTADLKFIDAHFYALARNGTTKLLVKDSSTLASTTQASTGAVSVLPVIGALNNNGTIQNRINAQFEYLIAAGPYSTFDLSGFITNIGTLLAGW